MRTAAHEHARSGVYDGPEVLDLVAKTSDRLNARQGDVTHAMSELLANIAYLDEDRRLRDLLEASVEGNVKTIFHILSNHISTDNLQPTTAAVEYALRLAQRGIPANSLIRAYHMGQDNLLAEFFAEVQRLECDSELKLKVVHYISGVLYRYIDWICLYLLEIYEQEKQRWSTASGNVHSSLIHKLVAGETAGATSFVAETGYSLNQFHVAAVLWVPGNSPSSDEVMVLERCVRDLAARTGSSSPPIFTAVDRNTAWAWFPRSTNEAPIDMDTVREVTAKGPVRIALGLPTRGVTGFRRSHQQAAAARVVTLGSSSDAAQAVSYGDQGVAIVSVLARDLESTATWVREVLGPLARNAEGATRLRETLHTFLSTGGSYTETAALLNLHRNSVKYRVEKASEERGRPLGVDRLDVELALQVCHFLGEAVLAD